MVPFYNNKGIIKFKMVKKQQTNNKIFQKDFTKGSPSADFILPLCI